MRKLIKSSLLKWAILSLYFSIYFIAISFFRLAILKHSNVPYSDFSLGIVRAILCAKFMIISQTIFPIKLEKHKFILVYLFSRSFIYLLMVNVFQALEKILLALSHHKNIVDSISGLQSDSLQISLSLNILYLLMIVPYVLYSIISHHLGDNYLAKFLLNR